MTAKERWALVVVALAATTSAACGVNTPIYFNGPQPLLELQGNEDPPRVTNGFTLRFRQPTADERKALDAKKQALGGVDVPWVSRDKVHLELLFTVKNLDTDTGKFDVVVDGASEFVKYDENVVSMALAQGEDEAVYIPLMHLHPSPLPAFLGPGETYQGIVREDDFNEAELDLDAMGRFMGNFAALLANRSEVSLKGLEMMPVGVVIPALMEVDVTLAANKHMTCEWTLRVRDDEDRLLHIEGDHLFQANPVLFAPAVAMAP
jgi:hypothetical protein